MNRYLDSFFQILSLTTASQKQHTVTHTPHILVHLLYYGIHPLSCGLASSYLCGCLLPCHGAVPKSLDMVGDSILQTTKQRWFLSYPSSTSQCHGRGNRLDSPLSNAVQSSQGKLSWVVVIEDVCTVYKINADILTYCWSHLFCLYLSW